jgi:hypothetical protein
MEMKLHFYRLMQEVEIYREWIHLNDIAGKFSYLK